MRVLWQLLRQAYAQWGEDRAPRLAAALAYYTIFSIAPLLVIAIAIVGIVLGPEAAQGQIARQIEAFVSRQVAEGIEGFVQSVRVPEQSPLLALATFGTLFLGAAGLVGQLQESLNAIWNVALRPGLGWRFAIRRRGIGFLMVALVGLLMLALILVNTTVSIMAQRLVLLFNLPEARLIELVNMIVLLGAMTVLFAILYKVLPDITVSWSEVWGGALATAILFAIGRQALLLYMSRSNVASTFGAASSVVVLLLWVYYSAQIFFFGAEFTQALARWRGAAIGPSRDAVWTGAALQKQTGLQPKLDQETTEQQEVRREEAQPASYRLGALGLVTGLILGILYRARKE